MARVPIPVIGASSKAASSAQQTGRTINLYPEVNEPDAKAVVALRAVPGQFRWRDFSESYDDLATRYVRGMHTMGDRAFCVIGNKLFELYFENSFLLLATLSTHTGFVGFSDNAGKLVLGDGTGFFTFDFDAFTLSPVLTTEGDELRGYYSVYINQQTLYIDRDVHRYYYSDVGDPAAVDDLSFYSAESNPDPILAAFKVGSYVWMCGARSIEPHQNYGNDADNPFQVVKGAELDIGIVSKRAACKAGEALYVIGKTDKGGGQVYEITSGGARIIGNQAVHEAIAKVLFAYSDLADLITMNTYTEADSTFIQINLPEAPATVNNPAQESQSWVLDVALPPELAWHRRGFMSPETGKWERHTADHRIFWRNRLYTGAYNAPHVYEQSLDYFRDNTDPLVKERISGGPVHMQGRKFRVLKVVLEMEVGVGRDGGVQGSDPLVILQYSWDDAKTWSDEIMRPVGKIGERVEIFTGPCGSGTHFNLKVLYSEPTRFTLTGAWADVEPV